MDIEREQPTPHDDNMNEEVDINIIKSDLNQQSLSKDKGMVINSQCSGQSVSGSKSSERSLSKDEDIIDSATPKFALLSAMYSKSFAYYTVNTRLPVIVTKVIDHLASNKDQIIEQYGEDSIEELKDIIGSFSKLKNELQTNKPFLPLSSDGADVDIWNNYLKERKIEEVDLKGPRWYTTIWLYAECYLYRRFHEIFELSKSLQTFDPFRLQKETSHHKAEASMASLGEYLTKILSNSDEKHNDLKAEFFHLIMLDLWGNSCDLSLSLGEISATSNFLQLIEEKRSNILVDDTESIWKLIMNDSKSSGAAVAFICDNTAYELFTDLCLADFLVTKSFADQITFHLKAIPWFVSDVTPHDFHWTLEELSSGSSTCLSQLAIKWKGYVDSGKWVLKSDQFWTLPFDFSAMPDLAGALYTELARAKLVVVKGDLNYRKLLRETNCVPTKSFHDALGKFHPTNLVALRTVKCDLICGLKRDQLEECEAIDPLWMHSGEYGVIQFDG